MVRDFVEAAGEGLGWEGGLAKASKQIRFARHLPRF